MLAAWAGRWALPVILLVAGVNFFWRLGSSSYFTDEAFSVVHSLPSFHTMFHVIARTETTPWTYFLFLHEWMIRTGSQTEWVTRLPSAVGGVLLVGATYWMAKAFVARRTALVAAALTAISPLVASYAQEARAYVFLMLAVVVCVGATVRGVQRPATRNRWLALGALSAFLAIWLHYTAISIVVPLLAWVATRSALTRRQRIAFAAVCLAAIGTVLPVLLEQYHYNPNGGAITGSINWNNLVAIVGTPFGTRVGTPVDLRTVLGALVVVAAVVGLLARSRKQVAERRLLVALAVFGLLALVVVDFTGKHILITRYTTITAPFLILTIVAACTQLSRIGAAALLIPAVAISLWGVVHDRRAAGFYAPADQVVDYIAPREHPGDFMLTPGVPLTDTPIFYYVTRDTRPKLHFFGLHSRAAPAVFRQHNRVWLVDRPRAPTTTAAVRTVAPLMRRYGFRAAQARVYTTSISLGVVLAVRVSPAAD